MSSGHEQHNHPGGHNRHSLTPSMRRGERPLRSSPLAGPSYSADKGGNLIQHTSALEEELARRRLSQADTHDGSALPTPPLSPKGGANDECQRHARPSFISLSTRPGSRDSLAPPSPASPTLRSRHSSPHIATNARLSQSSLSQARPGSSQSSLSPARPGSSHPPSSPASADWMTAAPPPTFSRLAARSSDVVLPVKASSRAGERIRLKSLPSKSGSKPEDAKHKSLKSIRSMSKLFKHEHQYETATPVLPGPMSSESLSRSRSSSVASIPEPATPNDIEPVRDPEVGQGSERERELGTVRKLWARVRGGVKRTKA